MAVTDGPVVSGAPSFDQTVFESPVDKSKDIGRQTAVSFPKEKAAGGDCKEIILVSEILPQLVLIVATYVPGCVAVIDAAVVSGAPSLVHTVAGLPVLSGTETGAHNALSFPRLMVPAGGFT